MIRDAIKFAQHFYKQHEISSEDDYLHQEVQTSEELHFPILKQELLTAALEY